MASILGMKKNILYGILIVLGVFLLIQIIPIGDYCGGLMNFLISIVILVLIMLIVLITSIIEIYRYIKNKTKFDFIPIIISFSILIIFYLIMETESDKFWTSEKLNGITISTAAKSGTLKLYNNGSFAAKYNQADFSCTYQGDYRISNDTLYLDRNELESLTENIFTTKYSINKKDSLLQPIKKGFEVINIYKLN
jgi:hypothetical protein